ncbi:MAG: hypothetical protein M1830_007197 [Pleopsidium flavum]|nr:MAG: hypothetical protein M1830_007197 [Pleopsidium flavum]
MTLLDSHLEQISLSAAAISELPFLPPRVFTNALLHPHDITALIRDTEAHERALFTVPSSTRPTDFTTNITRRNTVFNVNEHGSTVVGGANSAQAPRKNTAVAMLLGRDMVEEIRKSGGGGVGVGIGNNIAEGRGKDEVNVEIFLEGAEKLCGRGKRREEAELRGSPIPGAEERIATLRTRYGQLSSSIARQEARVEKQAAQLDKMNRPKEFDEDEEDLDRDNVNERRLDAPAGIEETQVNSVDPMREEEEIKELEKKKRGLEDRVSGMERDLGGLLR